MLVEALDKVTGDKLQGHNYQLTSIFCYCVRSLYALWQL